MRAQQVKDDKPLCAACCAVDDVPAAAGSLMSVGVKCRRCGVDLSLYELSPCWVELDGV